MPRTNTVDSLVTPYLTGDASLSIGDDTSLELREMSAAATPRTGSVVVYAKSDGRLYAKDDAGVESYLTVAPQFRTISRVIYIEDPTATDEFPIAYMPDAATMVAVRAVTDVGSVDFNIEKRAKLTPDVAGTAVWSIDKQATSSGLEQTTFDSGAIGVDSWLHYSASAVTSAPTKLWISLEYTID